MKIATQVMAFGNLLALLAALGLFLAAYPHEAVGPAAAGLLIALSAAVFIGQRAYIRLLARRPPEPPISESPFAARPGWLDDWRGPGLLIAGNLLFAALVLLLPYVYRQGYERFRAVIMGYDPNYASFIFELSGLNPHPVYYFVRGGLVFLALMVGLNVLFNLAVIVGRRPRRPRLWLPPVVPPQRLFLCVLGGLILALVLGWNYHYGSNQRQLTARLALWPQYETVGLYDGQTVKLAPPPGYIRVKPDHPALRNFLAGQMSKAEDWEERLLAVYAADQKTYRKIIENLDSGRCDYGCTVGLAWIQQNPDSVSTYVPDPVLPLNRATSWEGRPPPLVAGYRASAPDYFIDTSNHYHQAFGNEVRFSELNVNGRVIVGSRSLTTRSYYGQEGRIEDEQRRQYLDRDQKWLRALSGWSPPPPSRPCPGLELEPGLDPQFPAELDAELLASWKYGNVSPSRVTSLVYNGEYGLVLGRNGGDLEIWDLRNNTRQVLSQAHSGRVTALSFTQDGSRFFSASPWKDAVKLWDASTGELILSLTGFTGPVVPFGPGSLYLAARESEVYLLDSRRQDQSAQAPDRRSEAEISRQYAAAGPKAIRRNHRHDGRVRALAADPEGRLAAVGTASGYIYLYRLAENEEGPALEPLWDFKVYQDRDEVMALYFDLESDSLYAVAKSGRVDEWSLPGLKLKRSLPTAASLDAVHSAVFLREPWLLAMVGSASDDRESLVRGSFIELMHPASGQSIVRPIAVSSTQVDIIEPLGKLIGIQGHAVLSLDIPESFCRE